MKRKVNRPQLPGLILLCACFGHPAIAAVAQDQVQTPGMTIERLVATCAPEVHPNTMLKILKHESGLERYIIGVNETPRRVFRFDNAAAAATKARELIAQGKSIDMGLGQINSVNLPGLKMTPEQVFEPCENIKASAYLIAEAYTRTSARFQGHAALDQALSIYNTGRVDRGIANGYVSRVRATRYVVPALDADAAELPPQAASVAVEAQPEGPPPAWDVFANAQYRGPRASEAPAATEPAAALPAAVMLFPDP